MLFTLTLGLTQPIGIAGPGAPPPDPQPEPGNAATLSARIARDVAWSWHIQKTAVYDSTRDRIYSGAVSIDPATGTAGSQWIMEFDGSTGEYLTRHLVNTGYIADDHNAPALFIENGRLICGLAGHNDASEIKVAWSSDTNPANMGSFTTLSASGLATYIQLSKIGSTLYMASRIGTNEWQVWSNTSSGDPTAWGVSASLVTSTGQTYMAGRSTGASLAMVMWDHPTNTGANRGLIRIAEVSDPKTDGPIAQNSAATLYTPPGGDSSRVLSVNDDATQILYAIFTVGAEPADYYLARLTGSDRTDPADWTHEALGQGTQSAYYTSSEYISGGEVYGSGATATNLFLAWADSTSDHVLEHWSRATSGDGWTKTRLARSDWYLARPIGVDGAEGKAIVQVIFDYTDFTDFEIDAFSVVETDASIGVNFPNIRVTGAGAMYDYIDDTNGTSLAAHTADTGQGWTMLAGTATVQDNRVYGSATPTLGIMDETVDADATVSGTIRHVAGSVSSDYAYIVGRCDGTADNFVMFGIRGSSAPDGEGYYLYEFVGGSATKLDSSVASLGGVQRLRMEFSGSTVTCYANEIEVCSATVTASGNGYIGVRSSSGTSATKFHTEQVGAIWQG